MRFFLTGSLACIIASLFVFACGPVATTPPPPLHEVSPDGKIFRATVGGALVMAVPDTTNTGQGSVIVHNGNDRLVRVTVQTTDGSATLYSQSFLGASHYGTAYTITMAEHWRIRITIDHYKDAVGTTQSCIEKFDNANCVFDTTTTATFDLAFTVDGSVYHLPTGNSVRVTLVLDAPGATLGTVIVHNGNARIIEAILTRVDGPGVLFSKRIIFASNSKAASRIEIHVGWTLELTDNIYQDIVGAIKQCFVDSNDEPDENCLLDKTDIQQFHLNSLS